MTATSPDVAYPRPSLHRRLISVASMGSVPMRALLASRLIVLAAGPAGALAVPRRHGWATFDPGHLSARLGAVGNVLAAASVRWDSIHYLAIAGRGYTAASSTVFFPLYPLLIRMLGDLVGSAPLAGVVISAVSLGTALTLLHRLTDLELGRRAADATVLLVAFAPLSFFFTAVYTESLFLALSLGAVYAGRRGRWRLAAGLGGLAALTRFTGVLLVLPLAIMRLQESRRPDRGLAWLLVIPAALTGYLGFVAARGFGLLAPFTQETGSQYQRSMTGPIGAIGSAARAAFDGLRSMRTVPIYHPSVGGPFSPGAESVLLLMALVIAVAALVVAFRRLPLAYGAYAAVSLVLCISSPVAAQPLRSVDRYTLTIFPLWMAAGVCIAERRLTRASVLVGAGLLAFFAFQFATWAWIA